MIELLAALAGGVGAGLRFLVDGAVTSRLGTERPCGTFVVNVTGSLAMGLASGWLFGLGPAWATIAGAGLLGGYTTFSTATWEAVTLLRHRAWRPALVHTLGMLVACVGAAYLGFVGAALAQA